MIRKTRRRNPVAKFSERFNRPKTIESKKDKLRQGKQKYPKQSMMEDVGYDS